MSKKKIIPLLLMIIFSLVTSFAQSSSANQAQPNNNNVTILEADERHVLLALTLPDVETETITHEGLLYQQLSINGWNYWGQPGQPQLPMQAMLLGMPTLGQPTVEIVSSEQQTLTNYRLAPNPAWMPGTEGSPQAVFSLDTASYQQNNFLPNVTAEAVAVGLMRDQPVFKLLLYPFQYHPQRQELRLYKRLTVRVTFPHDGTRQNPLPLSGAFAEILQRSLLNYDSLPHSAIAVTSPLPNKVTPMDNPLQVKLWVKESGLYRVSYSDLLAISPELASANPQNLELSHQGTALPMTFEGNSNNSFEAGESFVFYGQAIQSEYTSYNVYWLKAKDTPGLRMTEADGTPAPLSSAVSFTANRHNEQNKVYWQALPNGEGQEHWFWDKLTAKSNTSHDFTLRHLADNPTGEIRLMLRGGGPYPGLSYSTQVYLNNTPVFSVAQTWNDRVENLLIVPSNLFVEGNNQLRVENLSADTEFYLNWFEVAYQANYIADNDQLLFTTPITENTFTLNGFSTPDLHLFDITNPTAPIRIINGVIETVNGNSQLRFTFTHPDSTQQFIGQRRNQTLKAIIKTDEASNWKSPTHAATYLIITNPAFYGTAQKLASYRQSHGETVAVVKSDDLYDEFNGGIYDPQAIRDFLGYAYDNWTTRPTYVLLVGDASLDPKNYLGNSFSDLLPAHYIASPLYGQAPSDLWYSTIHGDDDYPDVIIGRLPVRYGNELEAIITKIENYEQSPPPGGWMRRAVLVAYEDFEEDMNTVASLLPSSITAVKMVGQKYNGQPIQEQLKAEINQGTLILAYSGHGNEGIWGKDYGILYSNDIDTLTNGNKLPFMTAANCLTGFFAGYATVGQTMAERFLFRKDGGGIAVWAPSSYGFPTPNSTILPQFYQALMSGNHFKPGLAATVAHANAYNQAPDLLIFFQTFNYLGDPAMSLEVPVTLATTSNAPNFVNMGQLINYNLTYTVSGEGQARNLTLIDTLPDGVTYLSASLAPSSRYAQQLTWNFGNMSANSQIITITVRVNDGLMHGQVITNTAQLNDAIGGGPTAQRSTVVYEEPIVGLIASHDAPTVLGNPTNFSAAVSAGSNVIFRWDFGDAPSPFEGEGWGGVGASVQHTYTETKSYSVKVTAQNSISSQSQTLNVPIDLIPKLTFNYPRTNLLGQTATFWSDSIGSNLIYIWDYGDGFTVTGNSLLTVTHLYTQNGRYTPTLTISNSVGHSSAIGLVDVLSKPVAMFAINSPIQLGQPAVFSNSSQIGGDFPEKVINTWDFGDTPPFPIKGGAGGNVTHLYTAIGSYGVTLTVQNRVASDTVTATVVVTDIPINGLTLAHDAPTMLGNITNLTASVLSGSNVRYLWDWGESLSTQETKISDSQVQHLYTAVGSYSVKVTATNSMSYQVQTAWLTVTDSLPQANFNYDQDIVAGATLFTTTFEAASSGSNLRYQWNFGDGTPIESGGSMTITHPYMNDGAYRVVLTASNSAGNSVVSQLITVVRQVQMPLARFTIYGVTIKNPAMAGQSLNLNNTSHDGGDLPENVTYQWNFGNGFTRMVKQAVYSYATAGTYRLTLTVTNSIGSSSFSQTVVVTENAISGLTIQQEGAPICGQVITLSAKAATGSNITYQWSWGEAGETITHTFKMAGDSIVWLTATNGLSTQTVSDTIHVKDEPIVGLIMNSSSATVGQPMLFTATTTTGTNIRYLWDFGDGFTSTLQNPAHTYINEGTYYVVVQANNGYNAQTASAMVTATANIIQGLQLTVSLNQGAGTPIIFSATVTGGTVVTYLWDFGDGQTAVTLTPMVTHTYIVTKDYNVQVTAQNDWSVKVATNTVSIQADVPIKLTFAHENPTILGQPTFFTATLTAGTNVLYQWDFGDALSPSKGEGWGGAVVSHTYQKTGEYQVVLTATNSWGTVVTQSWLTVQDECPPNSSDGFLTVVSNSPTMLEQATILTATVYGVTITNATHMAYSWTMGDGQEATGSSVLHYYSAPGLYTVAVTARNGKCIFNETVSIMVVKARVFLPLVAR